MKTLFAVLLAIICTHLAVAQQWKNYTFSGNVNCIAIDKDTVWIGSNGGVAKYLTNGTPLNYYTKVDGLAANFVTSIAIDSTRHKWFATGTGYEGQEHGIVQVSNGVTEFNGINFTTYNPHNSGLADSNIVSVAIDQHNYKWFKSGAGVFYRYDGLHWLTYNNVYTALMDGFPSIKDTHGNVWYGFTGNGDSITEYNGTTFTSYSPPFGYGALGCYTIDKNNNLWVGAHVTYPHSAGGLFKFDGHTWFNYTDSVAPYGDEISPPMFVDNNNNLWFISYNGLCRYGTNGVTNFAHSTTDSNTIAGNAVSTIAIDAQNHLWAGISGAGVDKFDGTNWTLINPSNSQLQDNFFISVATDYKNRKWFMPYVTYDDVIEYNDTAWNVYSSIYGAGPGYAANIYVDNQDNKWFGAFGLGKLDDNNDYTYFSQLNDVVAVATDQNEIVWCATESEGLLKYDGNNWTNTQFFNDIYTTQLSAITVDRQGYKWIGTYNNGIEKTDGWSWINYNPLNSGMPDTDVVSVAVDHENNIWIGTASGGVAEFNGTNWVVYNTSNSSLPGNYISAIAFDKHGNKWFAVYETNLLYLQETGIEPPLGIAKFDGTAWTVYNQFNSGLSTNCVNSISVDEQNNVWIATCGGGISEILGTDTALSVTLQYYEGDCGTDNISLYPYMHAGTPPYTYSWQVADNSALSCNNCQFPTATSAPGAIFIVTVTDSNHAVASDTVQDIGCINTAVAPVTGSNHNILVAPNPFNSSISVIIHTDNLTHVNIAVTDITGKTVFNENETNVTGTYTTTLNMGSLANGIYMLVIQTDGNKDVRKIVKQ